MTILPSRKLPGCVVTSRYGRLLSATMEHGEKSSDMGQRKKPLDIGYSSQGNVPSFGFLGRRCCSLDCLEKQSTPVLAVAYHDGDLRYAALLRSG